MNFGRAFYIWPGFNDMRIKIIWSDLWRKTKYFGKFQIFKNIFLEVTLCYCLNLFTLHFHFLTVHYFEIAANERDEQWYFHLPWLSCDHESWFLPIVEMLCYQSTLKEAKINGISWPVSSIGSILKVKIVLDGRWNNYLCFNSGKLYSSYLN